MENLDKAISSLKLEDLKINNPKAGSNLIEPTETEIKLIISALKDGKGYKEIKKTIRRTKGKAQLGFSYGQIKDIDIARQEKIAELTPKKEPEELTPVK